MYKKTYLILAGLLAGLFTFAQPKQSSAGDLYQQLRKLGVLGSVLYVAAHPDDENTSVISYYANEELFRTGYLSATRGDGGQNLIGSEIREQLGIIRTQELLSARGTDGGQQFFSRANDFGYSKNPEETFNMWDKQEILADFVWVYRKFRPDVIITRFDDQPPNHGHHTASAILAREAFKLAANKNAFPEQLKLVDTWQPQRIYWNTHPFFFQRRGVKFDTANYGQVPIGRYNPLHGLSYTEMSSLSRSMHKSQGFGSTGKRGERSDYVTQWEGSESLEPLEGIDVSWNRVKGGKKVKPLISDLLGKFDPANPSAIVPDLLEIKAAIAKNVKDDFWKNIKLAEVDQLLQSLTGLYVEITANDYAYTLGDSIELTLEAVNRSGVSMELVSAEIDGLNLSESLQIGLDENSKVNKSWKSKVSSQSKYSNPYWLEEEGSIGRYKVDDQNLRGLPENPAVFPATIFLKIGESAAEFTINTSVVFKRNDPVDGEVYRPLVIQPAVMANIESASLIFSSNKPKEVDVRVIAGKDNVKGSLTLDLPEGWSYSPESVEVNLQVKSSEQVFTFSISSPTDSSEGIMKAVVDLDGTSYSRGLKVIEYDHISTQTLFPKSGTKVVKLDIERIGEEVGYIMGAGDDIPQGLEQIGYNVTLLEKDDVTEDNLSKFQSIILGVRAFNTVEWLSFKNEILFEYVQKGGNLIVQYNTNRRMVTDKIAPFDLTLSRDRVTVEEAEVRILATDHQVMNSPNKITSLDFDGWVQERGLYFPSEWAEDFTPILSSNDPDEPARDGGLLVARYGEGYYVYTGYSWFRELPAGVAGAYRIFTNLISLGNDGTDN